VRNESCGLGLVFFPRERVCPTDSEPERPVIGSDDKCPLISVVAGSEIGKDVEVAQTDPLNGVVYVRTSSQRPTSTQVLDPGLHPCDGCLAGSNAE